MTKPTSDVIDSATLGTLAFALVFEDLKARVERGDLSEDAAQDLFASALGHIPDPPKSLQALMER